MKRIVLFISFLACTSLCTAQFSVLFVDDSKDQFGNSAFFKSALDSLGYEVTIFDAESMGFGPSAAVMNDFDLTIWHTSSDGVGLQFWGGNDEDNEEIKAYLDAGGNMWIVGLDFMFDRYDGPGDQFEEGDFPFDYLGIRSYDAQSYGNDGNLGVPMMVPNPESSITGLDTLRWQFPTLWWADAVEPRAVAEMVYSFGEAPYVLSDAPTGVLFKNNNGAVLTYFFDLAVVSNFEMLKSTTAAVMQYFEAISTSLQPEINSTLQNVSVFPNPVTSQFSINFELLSATRMSIYLQDLLGKNLSILTQSQLLSAGNQTILIDQNQIGNPEPGMYFVVLQAGQHTRTVPIFIQK